MKSKKKKKSISFLKKKLWGLTRQIVFRKHGNSCFTCGARNLTGANLQCGHFIPSSTCGAFLRYDFRNLRPQCFRCNINGGGQGAEFYKNVVKIEGQEYVDQLFRDKNIIVKADAGWYQEKIDLYTGYLESSDIINK
ncbi:MAG TPA: recombination protein NinG [Candidatus Nanoarchaeia archaeon]|nr:recombination protein NinG [Candidatus Nanoarchaeia archaeon]